MLINVRNKEGKLLVKDILDVDFDMSVEEEHGSYYVFLNQLMKMDEEFKTRENAERRMLEIAGIRNRIEEELRIY